MTFKRKLVIVLSLLACAGLLLLLAAVLFYRAFLAPLFAGRELPPELREARVVVGAEFLSKSEFYRGRQGGALLDASEPRSVERWFDSVEDVAVGELDGQPGLDVGLVGRRGATLLDRQGNAKRHFFYQFEKSNVGVGPFEVERMKDNFGDLRALDIEGDGVWEIFGYGGLDGVSLFDHQGRVLLSRGEYVKGGSYIKQAAAGDVDGDGVFEFVASWGYDPSSVELFDLQGNSRWQRQEQFSAGHLEVVDVNGDGRPEIIEENGSSLKIRDAEGNVTATAEMPVYLWHLSLCPRPGREGPPQNLAVREGSLWLIDLDGKNYSKFDAPLSEFKLAKSEEAQAGEFPVALDTEQVFRAEGVWVKLRRDGPAYLAVVANFAVLDRSLFYLYDEQGRLVHHEIMPEHCNAVAALPAEDGSGAADILLGGEKTVWRYAAR